MSEREKTLAEIREVVSRFMGAGSETEYDRALSVLSDYAGTWIPFLLSELERWKKKHKECAETSMMLADRNVEQGDEIERLRRELAEKDAKIERMSASSGMILAKFAEKTADFRTVLEMYASGKYDDGQRARDVLEKWERR